MKKLIYTILLFSAISQAQIINSYAFANEGGGGSSVNIKYPISGDYPSNDSQNWSYTLTNAAFIVSFNTFNTENNFDWLSIYKGTSNTDPLIARFSGTTLPPNVVVDGNVYIEFTSDGSSNGTGFDLDILDTATISYANAVINYPFIPTTTTSFYASNSDQSWIIPANGSDLTISFSRFKTEASSDFLYIYEGNSTSGTLLATYSGETIPSSVSTTTQGGLYLRFTSDHSVEPVSGGFTALITEI